MCLLIARGPTERAEWLWRRPCEARRRPARLCRARRTPLHPARLLPPTPLAWSPADELLFASSGDAAPNRQQLQLAAPTWADAHAKTNTKGAPTAPTWNRFWMVSALHTSTLRSGVPE